MITVGLHGVFGSLVTLLEYIKKVYLQRKDSQGGINRFNCLFIKNGWGTGWGLGVCKST